MWCLKNRYYSNSAVHCYGYIIYHVVLGQLKHDYTLIEYEPYQLVSFSCLQKKGITLEDIHDYCDRVEAGIPSGEYFTIRSVAGEGFSGNIGGLGYGDWFYASLLRESGKFVFQRNADCVIFRKSQEPISRKSFICDRIRKLGRVDRSELVYLLARKFGVHIDLWDITKAVSDTDIEYDPITQEYAVAGN